MSELYTGLVNQTVVEAVRVALDNYSAQHHTATEASALPGVVTAAEEDVIRRAVLTGLQQLHHVQNTLTDTSHGASIHAAVANGEGQPRHGGRAGAASSLRESMARLMGNSTALQEVVQQVAASIRTHLGDSHRPDTRGAKSVAAVYASAPEVTRVLTAAVEQQQQQQQQQVELQTAAHTKAGEVDTLTALTSLSAAHWMWLSATLVVGYLLVRLVFGRLLGFGGLLNGGRRRTRTVLIGLPDSGKTALFGQLVRHVQLRETRTSMKENVGLLLAARERGLTESTPGMSIVDCPGHPRLREQMLHAVGSAVNVVVVIDAVTVQESQHDGVAALAELLLGVLQSPEFYGVRRLLFVCTKRDEVTSYASKAVRKLLEAAMVASIESRQNAMGSLESVRDVNNVVIASRGRKTGGGGRRYMLSLDGGSEAGGGGQEVARSHLRGGAVGGAAKSFSFDQLGIPLSFVDVSSRPHPTEHRYSVAPVEQFILEK